MLGFWKNVCTTKSTIIGDVSSIVGPNVPYATPAGSWKEDFKPISISKYDLAGMMKSCNVMSEKSSSDLVVIDPLWIPIHSGSTKQEEEEKKMNNYVVDEYSLCNNGSSSSRYFLKSCLPCEIDKEILSGF
jgi:ornithine carbamoyltransferase